MKNNLFDLSGQVAFCCGGSSGLGLQFAKAMANAGADIALVARRTDLLQKPLVALIRAAYDIVTGGWDAEDVSAYLRTGLAGLTPEETDTLENYVLLWSIRGSAWARPTPWQQHPDGYGAPDTDESAARLKERHSIGASA